MLAGVPFPSPDLIPVLSTSRQRAVRAAVGDVHLQGLLATRQGAEVGHGPVQADQAQQALDEPGRLPQCHPEEHLHRQAGLDGRVTIVRLSPALAGRCGLPGHGGIEPDRHEPRRLSAWL